MRSKIMRVFTNRLMIVIGLSFIIYHLSFSPVGAQTFTQRLQQSGGNATVTVHHDKSIDALVNGAQLTVVISAPKKTVAEKGDAGTKPAAPVKPQTENTKEKQPATPHQNAGNTVDTLAHNRNVQTYRTTGYRVQVFAGGNSRKDRQKAEQTGNELRALFPAESVYVHFYSPRWICRMGNYKTYEEATQVLQNVKQLGYTAATIVKGKITVPY